tara:strand:- start:303 stop:596 length:294 start_codon:yes stop_codon:yes gene_type:complete
MSEIINESLEELSFEEQEEENVKQALELINSGKWLQLEGSVGRFCAQYLDANIIVEDIERTKEEGAIEFKDGYGRHTKQPWCKIDWEAFYGNIERSL